MKKMLLTDKGKGWAGITVNDPELYAVAESFVRATRWRGPFEVEALRDREGQYHLIEVNPRFPAWCYLSAAAGVNLPRMVVELAAGREVAPRARLRGGEDVRAHLARSGGEPARLPADGDAGRGDADLTGAAVGGRRRGVS